MVSLGGKPNNFTLYSYTLLNPCLSAHCTSTDNFNIVLQMWAYEVLRLMSPESSYRDQRVIPRALRWGKGYRGKSAARGHLDFFRGELDRLTSAGVCTCLKYPFKVVLHPYCFPSHEFLFSV